MGLLVTFGLLLLSEGPRATAYRLRLLLMGTGLSLGAAVFLLGVALAVFTFWKDLTSGLGVWLEKPSVLAWPVGVYLAGLALMFAGVQPALPVVRQDQNVR